MNVRMKYSHYMNKMVICFFPIREKYCFYHEKKTILEMWNKIREFGTNHWTMKKIREFKKNYFLLWILNQTFILQNQNCNKSYAFRWKKKWLNDNIVQLVVFSNSQSLLKPIFRLRLCLLCDDLMSMALWWKRTTFVMQYILQSYSISCSVFVWMRLFILPSLCLSSSILLSWSCIYIYKCYETASQRMMCLNER